MKGAQPKFRKAFAKKLRAHRTLRGFDTARDFSAAFGIQENTYTTWERGESLPNLEQFLKICWLLGITPNDLLLPRLRPGEFLSPEHLLEYGIEIKEIAP